MSQPPLLLTVGEIARRLQTKVHRIEYIIRSRHIEATGWAGHARVFSEASFDHIASELKRIDEERSVTHLQPPTRKEATR
jgi:dihydroorotase-like cyclic amidohydrolase